MTQDTHRTGPAHRPRSGGPATELATLGGLTLTANPIRGQHGPEVALAFAGVPGDEIRMNLDEIGDPIPPGSSADWSAA